MGGTQDNGTWLYAGTPSSGTRRSMATVERLASTSAIPPSASTSSSADSATSISAPAIRPPGSSSRRMLNSGEAVGFYWPEIADPGRRHDVHGLPARLADEGQRRQPARARGELPRVHDARQQARAAATGWRSAGPAVRATPAISPPPRSATAPAARRRDRAHDSRQRDAVGGDLDRTRVHHEKRRRRTCHGGDVHAARLAGRERLPNRFTSGIAVDPANPNHAWISYSGYNTTVGSVTPGHVFEVTFNPVARPRPGPTGATTWATCRDRRRLRRRDGRFVCVDRLRRPAPGGGRDVMGGRGEGLPVVDPADDRPGRTPPLCGDTRDGHLVHEPSLGRARIRSEGRPRRAAPFTMSGLCSGSRFTGSSEGHARAMTLRTLAGVAAAMAVSVPAVAVPAAAGGPTVTVVSKSPPSAARCLVPTRGLSP